MGMTRKEFFRQGILSLGKTALDIADTFKEGPAGQREAEEDTGQTPEPRLDMVAQPFNERCLARNCGCFACSERCESQAIQLVMGTGIRVDEALCTGCGSCEYVCPVTPRAISLKPRNIVAVTPACDAENIPTKGE